MAASSPPASASTAALFHALSDSVRLGVIEILQDGEHCVCDLTEALDVSQSRLSWHLKTLTDSGMIAGRKSGRWVYYSLIVGRVSEARSYLAGIKLRGRARLLRDCCD